MSASEVARSLRRWVAEAGAVLVPVQCVGCGMRDRALCGDCTGALQPERAWPVPGVALGPPGEPVVRAALEYGGVVAQVLGAVKEHGRTDLVRHLAPALRCAIDAALDAAADSALDGRACRGTRPFGGCGTGDVVLVTMPSASDAVRRRGFRPVAALTRHAGHG
ncbi:MAG: hypothetical protein Q7T71_00695, partial [Herbiconiux sp.]|nr:hypothetical protein [Herbiconiux sp.]